MGFSSSFFPFYGISKLIWVLELSGFYFFLLLVQCVPLLFIAYVMWVLYFKYLALNFYVVINSLFRCAGGASFTC